jgi:hypothetical protein
LSFFVLHSAFCLSTFAQGTAFTYQGRLEESGQPAHGLYDFRCELYDAVEFGTLVSTAVTNTAVTVTNGLFALNLDFGAAPFIGAERWLHLGVRTNGALIYVNLTPRQRLAPTPYAIQAGNVTGMLAPASLPIGGNWVLYSTLTLDTPTLAIDPVNNRVGIGTATPAWPLDMVAAQSVARLVSTANAFGSVLELRNNSASPTYLGAINFSDAAGTYPGQIGYLGSDTLVFRTAGAERMSLSAAGNLVVAAASGTAVRGDASAAGFGGIGVQGDAGAPFGLGIYGRAPWAGSVGVRGVAESTDSAAITAEAMATSSQTWGVRGLAHSGAGTGVAGENDANTGIGVYGLQGSGTGSRVPAGVYGESLQSAGNGVVGVANNGPSAYGVWGRSTSGFAGAFDGAVRISGDSSHGKPFLQVHETQDGDYARIQLQVASRPLWHVSVGGADNSLVFYNSTNSIVTSISESGTLTTRVLTITGGADIAEPFAMSQPDLPKGAVVVIDEDNAGHLTLSREAYDKRVAGVISGAGGVNPGLSLSQHGVMEGSQHVALTGRVYVQADATSGTISPGDLLTTSTTPGHAMKTAEPSRAHGAILGKAMTCLKDGKGLVLVLVALQ